MPRKKQIHSIETKLPELDFNYEILAEYANVYFWSVDETGRILYVNECMCSALGYSKQELANITAFELAPEYNSDGVYQWNRIDEVLQNPSNPPVRNFELRCKNGSSLWLELRTKVYILPKTKKHYSVTIGIDTSERRIRTQEFNTLHSHLFLSVFLNDALEKSISFSEVSQYAEALSINLIAPIACLFLLPRSEPCLGGKEQSNSTAWKLWAIPCLQKLIPEKKSVLWDSRGGLALLFSLSSVTNIDQELTSIVTNISETVQKFDSADTLILGVSDIWKNPESISVP